jgi:iron complex transport system ATP-binding protein
VTGTADLLDQITATVDYLRVDVGIEEVGWLRCAPLVADADVLARLVESTKAGRGTERLDVALSLFVQGYSFRIASLAIGAWILADAVLDLVPDRTAIALGRDRPNAVAVDRAATLDPLDPLDALAGLHAHLIDGHLARLVATAHRACRVGEPLLWGNVAASCASSFGAFASAPACAHRRVEIRDRAVAFFASARPEVRDAGRVVPVADRFAWERKSCCLWYRTESGFRCEDCSLWSDEERAERYRRLEAETSA